MEWNLDEEEEEEEEKEEEEEEEEEEEKEEKEEEEEEESKIEDWGIRPPYKRHKWMLVASWSKIDLPEACRREEKIMIDDFNIGGGIPRIDWPEPGDKKIRPFSFK